MSIKITAEELSRQYLNGKSIRELSLETGKGEWAIRKQIQRYQNRLKVKETNENIQERMIPIAPKQSPGKKFAGLQAAIGFLVAIYLFYMEIKKRRDRSIA